MANRAAIAHKVRELRKSRGWTQARLAEKLDLSQGRLSEIERGGGSFTAEQFLTILQLFNVSASTFAPELRDDLGAQLQNAVARLGGSELQEIEHVLPSERIQEVGEVILQVLLEGNPRLIASLAPVLVANIDRVNLDRLHARLSALGFERRLWWLADNVRSAIRDELAIEKLPRSQRTRYLRADLVLQQFLDGLPDSIRTGSKLDILDSEIRSPRTLDDAWTLASPFSKRWKIVTSLEPKDFRKTLKAAHVARD